MNKKQQTEEIKNSINMCLMRLKTIKPHLTPDKIALNESYNKLLIEKAILRDKLFKKQPSFFNKLLKSFKSSKKTLICDYFK